MSRECTNIQSTYKNGNFYPPFSSFCMFKETVSKDFTSHMNKNTDKPYKNCQTVPQR